MLTKMLVLDLKKADIPLPYLARLKKACDEIEFIPRSDKKRKSSLAETDVILGKITTKIDKEVIDAAPKLKYVGVLAAVSTPLMPNTPGLKISLFATSAAIVPRPYRSFSSPHCLK